MSFLKKAFFIAIPLFLLAPRLAAQTADDAAQDVTLSRIDALISHTEYDEALQLLTIYIDENPGKFDAAQSRIQKIMNARLKISELVSKLLRLVESDSGNIGDFHRMITQLENQLGENPDPAMVQFIEDIKRYLNYYNAYFLLTLRTAAKLTGERKYDEAVAELKAGYWVERDTFDAQWGTNQKVVSEVDKLIAEIDSNLADFYDDDLRKKLSAAAADFSRSIDSRNYEEGVRKLRTVKGYAERYARLVTKMYATGNEIGAYDQNRLKKLNPESPESLYLYYMAHYVLGEPRIENSGYAGILTNELQAAVEQMKKSVDRQRDYYCERYFSALSEDISQRRAQANDANLAALRQYTELAKEVNALYSAVKTSSDERYNPYPKYEREENYVAGLFGGFGELCGIYDANAAATPLLEGKQQNPALFSAIKNLNASYEPLRALELGRAPWSLYGDFGFEKYTRLYESYYSQVFRATDDCVKGLWESVCQNYREDGAALGAQSLAIADGAQVYLDGIGTRIPGETLNSLLKNPSEAAEYAASLEPAQSETTYRYPSVALNMLKAADRDTAADIKTVTSWQDTLRKSRELNTNFQTEYAASLLSQTDSYLEQRRNELSALNRRAVSLADDSQKQVNAAKFARDEAELRFSEAERALRQESFDLARRRLQESVEKFNQSLAVLEDESLRASCDAKIQSLSERIVKTENEVVVKEVRRLKTQAKDAYFNGRFDDAESLLNQAKARWAVTHVEEDEEINSIMSYVNTAISMQSGREILPSSPLYPEMSQLMSVAYQYYDSGKKKLERGNRAEGIADLDESVDKLQQLQYVYPLNQEASILTLRINMLKDPEKFNAEFSQKIEAARAMCANPATVQEGYTNLLNYYEINPKYKGLKDLIYQVEIDIGVRQKPVDNTATKRSQELARQAEAILKRSADDDDELERALELVNQAIALNPNNNSAMLLKDRIAMATGGNASTVLSMEDEEVYQRALQKLQNNDVITANLLTTQLLQKKRNAKNKKLLELKNKIDARL